MTVRARVFFLTLLILSAAISAAAQPAYRDFSGNFTPSDNGERLLALLVSITDPEFLELRMDEPPDEDGNVRSLSVFVRGASLGGFRVERLALESAFVQLAPPATWRLGDRHSLRVKRALRSNFELAVNERDVLEALETYAAGSWSRIFLDMSMGEIAVRGAYRPPEAGLSILAGMKTELELHDGERIMLRSPEIRINGEERTDLFRRDLDRLQPVIDFADFPFRLTLSRLSVDGGALILGTATPPSPVEGIVFRYVRSQVTPFAIPERTFNYAPDLFRNGDMVFVNGRTWRSKIVNLLERGPKVFSHTGIVRLVKGAPHVIHASPDAETVQLECLDSFLSPDEVDNAAVYRVRGNDGAAEIASRKALEYYLHDTPFDPSFNIEDESRLYCTELLWRAYKFAGIDLADGEWDYLHNPVLQGRLLLPYRLSRSPWLIEVMTLQ